MADVLEDTRSAAQAIIDAAEKWREPKYREVVPIDEGRHKSTVLAFVPKTDGSYQTLDLRSILDAHADRPAAVAGLERAASVETMIDLIRRGKNPRAEPALFLSGVREGAPKLVAVMDYHAKGVAEWGRHKIVYDFPLSDRWKAWTSRAGALMTQENFAEHISMNVLDVVDPMPELSAATLDEVPGHLDDLWKFRQAIGGSFATRAEMTKLSSGIEITATRKVTQAVRLDSGEKTLYFEEQHGDKFGGKIFVPNLFLLALPVFHGGAMYVVAARLNYRLKEQSVLWSYNLLMPDDCLRTAARADAEVVAEEADVALYEGAPISS